MALCLGVVSQHNISPASNIYEKVGEECEDSEC